MARGKRAQLVAQASLVWAGEDFDAEEFIASGETGGEVAPFNDVIRSVMCAALEGKPWPVEKT